MRATIFNPALAPALRPAKLGLALGTLSAASSGLLMLAAVFCLVQLVSQPSWQWVLAACLCWLSGSVLASLASYLAHAAEAKFSAYLRRQVANHLVRLPSSSLTRYGSESLRRLVAEDIAALHYLLAHLPSEMATFIVVPTASIILLISMAGPLALLALIPGIIAALCYLVLIPTIMARHVEDRTNVMSNIVTAADDYARGIRVSRIYATEAGALSNYQTATSTFVNAMTLRVGRIATVAAIAVALLQAVATFAIAYSVTYQHSTSALAAALLFSLAIVTPALRLGHGLDYLGAGHSAAKRLIAVLNEPALSTGQDQQIGNHSGLVLDNVSLTTPEQTVLHALSYHFQPHAITAITGPSGIGKSSLLRACAGLENLQQGSIKLSGLELSQLDETTKQQALLLIPQGGDVLNASVRENLALTAPDADDKSYQAALWQAQINLDLATDASQLSGGERQRIGLARAFLSSASILLFDEPTSALDHETAYKWFAALQQLCKQHHKTVLLVTHDPELAAKADQQLVLSRPDADTQGVNL